jgi:SH3 domain-containing YSC84-like protein 1
MKVYVGAVMVAMMAAPAFAQKGVDARLQMATESLHAMINADDKGIPRDLLNRASCVAVIPNLKKGGFIFGAEYGAGFVSCRKPGGAGWSAPGDIKMTGGKFGLLVGGAETDVVMLVMKQSGMQHLLSDKFQIGGDVSAAAGPIGRDASAMTDAEMHAEILTYSRSRGIFGGLDLSGTAVTTDQKANKELYGHEMQNKEIIQGETHTPSAAHAFVSELDNISIRK